MTRSYLKNRILVQVQGGNEFQPANILKYFEELGFGPNAEIGTKGLFEMASIYSLCFYTNDLCGFRNILCFDFGYTHLVYLLNFPGFCSYTSTLFSPPK